MNKRRIFAWIGIIFIPLMFLISIILSLLDSPIAMVFLMATLILTIIVPTAIYLLTKYPKDIADIVTKFGRDPKDKDQTDNTKGNKKNRD